MNEFYDRAANLYHLVFQDWDESIERQAQQLASVIEARWKGASTILDVSCGIGTQAIGLAKKGFAVTASDLSEEAVTRAKSEGEQRGVAVDFSVCDMKAAHDHHRRQYDVVVRPTTQLRISWTTANCSPLCVSFIRARVQVAGAFLLCATTTMRSEGPVW
jgi:SAM-dependent methyltransferase